MFCVLLCISLLLPSFRIGYASGYVPDPNFENKWYEQEPTATGTGGAVATEHPLASQAAKEIMEQGGNAIDAAIAAHAVQNLVRPFAGGVGGGGMMNIYLAEKDEVVTLTHRSMSPDSFDITSFEDEDGNVIPQLTRLSSGMSVGVPGAVKAWEEALEAYGNLTFKEVLAPAIKHAKEGFIADEDIIREISENKYRLRIYESSRSIYLTEDGNVPVPGTIIKNPDLARTFKLISKHGSEVFYNGEIGEAIVNAVTNPPYIENPEVEWELDVPLPFAGHMTMDDIAKYRTDTGKPVHTTYRGYDYYGMPLVSSGGLMIGQMLNILEGYDLSNMSHSEFLHNYLEASRFAFADYRKYHGDPEHVDVPVDGIISKKYAEQLRQSIGETALIGERAYGDPWLFEDPTYEPNPLPDLEPGFSYDFEGKTGKEWDKSKLFVSSAYDTSYTLNGNGFGRIEIGARRNSAGRAISEMIWSEDQELLVPFRIDGFDGDRRLRFWLRGDGFNMTSSPYNGYAVEIKSGTDEIQLINRVDGSGTIIAKFDHERTNDLQWLRFKIVDDQISIKVWNDDQAEPNRWNLVQEDDSVTGAGRLLISTVELSDVTEGGAFEVGPIVVEETDEKTELESGFSYNFVGDAGDLWDATKFISMSTRDATMELTGEGTGRMDIPVNTAFANVIADMKLTKNQELQIPFQFTDLETNSNPHLRIWLRADTVSTTISPVNGFGVDIRPGQNRIRLVKAVNGSNTWFQDIDYKGTEEEQMLRFKVIDNQISVKIWDKKDAEPTDWTFVTTDNSVDRSGRLMIGAYEFGSSGAEVRLGKILVAETDETVQENPVEEDFVFEPRFTYEFTGNAASSWNEDIFSVETRNSIVEESGDGFGRIDLGENQHDYARVIPDMLAVKNKELLLRYKIDEIGSSRTLRLWLRGDEWDSNTVPKNGYSVEIKSGFNNIRIHKAINGEQSEIARFDYPRSNEEQMLRARIVDNQLYVKIWNSTEGEPYDWNLVYTDEDDPFLEEGRFLISAYEFTDNAGGAFSIGEISIHEILEATDDTTEINNEGETINVTVADQYGNIVAHTSTITSVAGSGIVVPGYGFMLNNVLGNRTRLAADEGEPNAAANLMKPLSTMSPTIIMKDGKPVFAGGSPGGLTIPTTVSLVLLLHLDRGMSLPAAVESARLSQENRIHGRTLIEEWFRDSQEYKELLALGHKFDVSDLTHGIGSFNGIAFAENGEKQAVAEAVRRGGGSAMAFNLEEETKPTPVGPKKPQPIPRPEKKTKTTADGIVFEEKGSEENFYLRNGAVMHIQ